MRKNGAMRTGLAAAACGVLAMGLSACGGPGGGGGAGEGRAGTGGKAEGAPGDGAGVTRIPEVGDRLRSRIPADSRQVVAVYGAGRNSSDSTVVLYSKSGSAWDAQRMGKAHNGAKGWTTDHHENDRRSPVGVFTLTDAGGVLHDPGALLPYDRSPTYQAPRGWAKSHWHDFDYVIAINYNRRPGTPPDDPSRPQGQSKGGGIWLHLDHGSGTSACVSLPKPAMERLLRTLDPREHPVVVMGDRSDLRA
ncbi:L,D-transpeptidase family protein [Streptomyces fagopyri]|uniref:L,D-transpeptidase family protein n=1 Tax=Streptomyces fagopyri TaxID=2662397 RepID=UPI0036A1574F